MYPGCVSAGEAAAELGKRCADAQRALDAEREKVKFGSCEVCWNLAWVLCRDDEPNAVPMKCANGTTYWRCDYCWYKQQLATLQAQLRQVEGERAKWEDIAGLRFAGDHKFVKEMELLKVENTTLRQLVEALPVVDGRMDVECGACYYIRSFVAGQYGVVCGLITEQSTAMAIKTLLEYRAVLAAKDAPHPTEEQS